MDGLPGREFPGLEDIVMPVLRDERYAKCRIDRTRIVSWATRVSGLPAIRSSDPERQTAGRSNRRLPMRFRESAMKRKRIAKRLRWRLRPDELARAQPA